MRDRESHGSELGEPDSALFEGLRQDARAWQAAGLLRRRRVLPGPVQPQGPAGRDGAAPVLAFLSNDYLGLAAHPALRAAIAQGAQDWGGGAGASPLVSGHLGCHASAEAALADFVGLPAALLFITGYMANLAVLASLLDDPQDVVFSDRLNHASLIDGCRLSRARVLPYPHQDLGQLEQLLRSCPGRRRLIASDAVFSMDGDEADVAALLELAERHDTLLLLDDAHGFGVCGPQGRGSLAASGRQSARVLVMGTLGKAAGLSGAFVAGSHLLIEHLLQRGRTYMFSTSPAPALAAAIPTALALVAAADARRAHLIQLAAQLARGSQTWRHRPAIGRTPIVPVLVGEPDATMALTAALAEEGVWVAGIRPPTVPAGTARLRISLSAAHQEEDIARLLQAARAVGLAP